MPQTEHFIKYLESRLADGQSKPNLHRFTNNIYTHYIDVVKNRPEEYVNEIGDMFEMLKAEEMDRQANLRDLYLDVDNPKRANAHAELLKAIEEGHDYGSLFMKKSAVNKEFKEDFHSDNEKRTTLFELMNYLTLYVRSLPGQKEHRKQLVKLSWFKLMTLDADLTWDKIKNNPYYRYCLYHTDTHLDILEPHLNEAIL